jgi:phage tail-like protein
MPKESPVLPEILTACRFYLGISLGNNDSGGIDAYFMECKGFKRTQEVIEVCEVTPQKWGKAEAKFGNVVRTKMPGNPKATNLVLKRGMTCSMTLWNWFAAVEAGDWAKQRKAGSLTIYDQAGKAQALFEFQHAFPAGYVIADVSSSSNEIEIEELEIAVEKLERKQPSGS